MADDMVVLTCEKCGTKLKIKTAISRSLREIKCVKCGAKVPTKQPSPVTTDSVPIPISTSKEAPNPPADPASPSVPLISGDELIKAQARIKELEQRVAGLLEQASQLASAKHRVAQLEQEVSKAAAPSDELVRARREIEEQSQRVSELQELWMQKEKEVRDATAHAAAALKERDAALAERDRTISAVRQVLADYHAAEVEDAQRRMAQLDERVVQLFSTSVPGNT